MEGKVKAHPGMQTLVVAGAATLIAALSLWRAHHFIAAELFPADHGLGRVEEGFLQDLLLEGRYQKFRKMGVFLVDPCFSRTDSEVGPIPGVNGQTETFKGHA